MKWCSSSTNMKIWKLQQNKQKRACYCCWCCCCCYWSTLLFTCVCSSFVPSSDLGVIHWTRSNTTVIQQPIIDGRGRTTTTRTHDERHAGKTTATQKTKEQHKFNLLGRRKQNNLVWLPAGIIFIWLFSNGSSWQTN